MSEIQNSSRFFANKDCQYYPCHKCSIDINCLFCFCPLYHLDCPGNYTITESSRGPIKNCKDCVFPHVPENYDKIMDILKNSIVTVPNHHEVPISEQESDEQIERLEQIMDIIKKN